MFETTRLSLIERALHGGDEGQKALGELYTIYRPLLRWYVCAHYRSLRSEADEIVDEFMFRKFVAGSLIRLFAPGPGRRFRALLQVALKNHCLDALRKKGRRKAKFSLDESFDRPHYAKPDEFDVAWARQVFGRAVRRLRTECYSDPTQGLMAVWGVLQARFLRPFRGKPQVEYDELVHRFGFPKRPAAQKAATKGKRLLAKAMLAVVSEYSGAEDAQSELDDLRRILQCADGIRQGRRTTSDSPVQEKERIVSGNFSLESFFDSRFPDRRVWHPQELRAILEHQWKTPVQADLSAQSHGQAQLLARLCDAEHLLLKSYGAVFSHSMPPVELVTMIKNFAKRNQSSADPELPGEIARLLYVLSVVVARIRCGRRITTQDDATVLRNIESALALPWLTQPVIEILNEGLRAFGNV